MCWISSKPSRTASSARMKGRNVAGNTQAAQMRVFGDRLHPLRLDRVVELDLAISVLRVPVDGFFAAFHVFDNEPAVGGKRAFAFDVTGGDDVGSYALTGIDLALQVVQVIVVVAHIA